MSQFSQAVSSLSRLGSWNTTPKRLRTSVACVTGLSPSSSSVPLVGRSTVVSILIVVVLPAPFGPRNANVSPWRTSNVTSLTAVTVPNVRTRWCTRIIGSVGATAVRLRGPRGKARGAPAAACEHLLLAGRGTQLPEHHHEADTVGDGGKGAHEQCAATRHGPRHD